MATPCLFAHLPQQSEVQELPITMHDGHLTVVNGSIGSLHSLRFLLDTGSTHTLIDRRIAKALNLSPRPARALSFGKAISLDCAVLPEITLGPVRAAKLQVLVADLRAFGAAGLTVDAVVGLDLLTKESFRLDLARKLVVFGEDSTIDSRSVPLRADAFSLLVQLELDGRPVSMILDTGSTGVTLYQDTVESLYADHHYVRKTFLLTAGGPVPVEFALVPRLRLGAQDLDRQVFLVPAPRGAIQPDVAGYLGVDALGAKEITFDFAHKQLHWRK